MSKSFSALKTSRSTMLSDLAEKAEKVKNPPKSNDPTNDDRFWKPTVDKAGNAMATFRFLPAPDGENVPWVRLYSHGFKGPTGKWYINNSRTTLELADPVGEYNSILWNAGDEETARKQKRRLHFISNIYMVNDTGNPANNGKVFLYRYGKKIFEKLTNSMNPEFEDEAKVNPFDLWEGADFKMKQRKVEGYPNYDKSEFAGAATLGGFDDDELEAIWKQCHSLQSFLDEKNFKSYEQLKKELITVIGFDPLADKEAPKAAAKASPKPAAEKPSTAEDDVDEPTESDEKAPWNDDDDDGEDELAKKLRELAGS